MINVVEWTRLEPWRVARARTDRGEFVIVKWAGPHVDGRHTEAWRLRTEVGALRFLAEDLRVDLAPRVLAEDLLAGRIILEDLAPRVALDGLLRADGVFAHAVRLEAFARARGELGAFTAGKAELYYRRRERLGQVDPEADRFGRVARLRREGLSQAEVLGVHVSTALPRSRQATDDAVESVTIGLCGHHFRLRAPQCIRSSTSSVDSNAWAKKR